MSDPSAVIDDLRQEGAQLDVLVAELSIEQWALGTPAPAWTVAHQIVHLAWTDRSALLAVCLLVTQRAHRADLALRAEGPDADQWLDIAQAFAGPSGSGRAPGGAPQ